MNIATKMNLDAEFAEPVTPASTFNKTNLWNATEDSGYHTSYTPGSIECSEISNENLDPKVFSLQAAVSVDSEDLLQLSASPRRRTIRCQYASVPSSPARRGRKRRAENDTLDRSFESVPTPTSYISGGIQRLHVNDTNEYHLHVPLVICESDTQSCTNSLYSLGECPASLSYPTTPVKKMCRNDITKLSPPNYNRPSPLRPINITNCLPKKSVKKLNFVPQTSDCLTPTLVIDKCMEIVHETPPARAPKVPLFKHGQKVDIIKLLAPYGILMDKVFSYMDNKDIYNFSLVSLAWHQACRDNTRAVSKRKEYIDFKNNTKENYDSREKSKCCEVVHKKKEKLLGDMMNLVNARSVHSPAKRSPPGTPRTIRFKKFTKSASLDSRIQMSCVRCRLPAKITKEPTGEEWVECGSSTCAFQFCKHCKCDRHPGTKCFQYDLEAQSPSKRKINSCTIGTKKSKKNLRRLLT